MLKRACGARVEFAFGRIDSSDATLGFDFVGHAHGQTVVMVVT